VGREGWSRALVGIMKQEKVRRRSPGGSGRGAADEEGELRARGAGLEA
jgi:hypothetical protein